MGTNTNTTTTRAFIPIALVAVALGAYATATSCIVHETPHFPCGWRWSGEATNAHAEGANQPVPVTIESEWVVWSECMSDAQHDILHEGDDAECHDANDEEDEEDREAACGMLPDCVFVPEFLVNDRPTAVCLFDDVDFQDAFRLVAESVAARCEDVAEGADLVPYPCEEILTEMACNQSPVCEFDDVHERCVLIEDDCTTAAAKMDLFTENKDCILPPGACEDTPAGTGDDGEQGALPPPSQVITQINSTTWQIDSDFWAMITQPINMPLLLGQSARIVQSGSNWIFASVTTNTYVFAMGLQNNDILWEINGQSLQGASLEDVEGAIGAVAGAMVFTFKVKRGTVVRTHTYIIN